MLARHILQERYRHGGNFVVAWSKADTKERRDTIWKIVGPELIFVVLTTVDQSLLQKRRQQRRQLWENYYTSEGLEREVERHEDQMDQTDELKDDEYKVVNIEITDGMKVEEVANKIIELIECI